MIEVYDNFIKPEKCIEFYDYCLDSPYFYGEKDNPDTPPVGMIHPLDVNDYWYKYFTTCIKNKCKIENMPIRAYINLFSPNESPYYHIDSDDKNKLTFLFYSNLEWNIHDCGETQFLENQEIRGILPLPNRAVLFSSNILHRATSFRNKPRFTLAIKYSPLNIL